MNVRHLLSDLQEQGVTFEADGDRISVDAPAGVIDESMRERLAENKPTIVKLLQWERRKLREADRRGLVIEWARERGWISLHDPATGEWHEVEASRCPPWVVEAASARARQRGRGRS